MLAFLTNMVPFLSYLSKILLFLTHFMKNSATAEILTKKKIICDSGSINMRISANEAYRFIDFSNITS